MVQFNFSERTIKAKVVYYGPAQSGKTTNLEQIHQLTDPQSTNRLISLNTAQDRTLFFDLLPFSLGAVSGYDFKVQIYTVPGQVQYNATRRVVLAGADAVVFVADSQRSAFKENLQAFENMKVNLLANRLVPEKVPLVLQYNKRDLADVIAEAELGKALNFWGRKAFGAVALRGQGVIETFVAVVQEMLSAIALKYNLKEKGLDPASVPEVVAQAFASLLKKVPAGPPPGAASAPSPPPAAKVVVAQATDTEHAHPLPPSPDTGLVSEELLHRAIRSNVELAEILGDLVRDINQGLGTILSYADLFSSYRDEAKRAHALSSIKREAERLRLVMADLGRATGGAGRAPTKPAPPTALSEEPALSVASRRPAVPVAPGPPAPRAAPPAVAPPPPPRAAAPPLAPPAAAVPASAPPPSLDTMLRDAADAARVALDRNAVAINVKVAPGTALPRCSPAVLHRAATSLLSGIASSSARGSSIVLRSERKPVLLRSKGGEVKRDFLMLALSHGAMLSPDDQQRILQGTDQGPFGEAYRLVREMGGFLRFAPLPGGALETRVFLPAVV
jgi:signal recognition particle receptor subunit beta